MRAQSRRLASAAALLALLAGPAAAADPYGTYMRPSTGTQVDFYDCGGKLCGKIVAVKDPKRKGEIGTLILKGAAKTGDNTWKGDLYNTDDGKTYSGVVTAVSKGLTLEGCVLGGVFCKGETWTKVH